MTTSTRKGKRRVQSSVANAAGTIAVTDKLTRDPFASFFRNDPWPPRMRKIFRMSNFLTLTTPGTIQSFGTEFIFNLGSPYLPITTPPAIPCYGWNTFSTIYNKYLVTDVEVDMEFTAPTDPCFVGAIAQSSNNTFTFPFHTLDDAPAWPGVYVAPLNPTGNQTLRLVQKLTNHRLEGLSKNAYEGALSQYSATMNAVPAQQPYIRVAAASGITPGGTVTVLVKLAYHVILFDRAQNNPEP